MNTYILYQLIKGEMTPLMQFHSIIKAEAARALEENFQRTYVAEVGEYEKLKEYEIERRIKYGK